MYRAFGRFGIDRQLALVASCCTRGSIGIGCRAFIALPGGLGMGRLSAGGLPSTTCATGRFHCARIRRLDAARTPGLGSGRDGNGGCRLPERLGSFGESHGHGRKREYRLWGSISVPANADMDRVSAPAAWYGRFAVRRPCRIAAAKSRTDSTEPVFRVRAGRPSGRANQCSVCDCLVGWNSLNGPASPGSAARVVGSGTSVRS